MANLFVSADDVMAAAAILAERCRPASATVPAPLFEWDGTVKRHASPAGR